MAKKKEEISDLLTRGVTDAIEKKHLEAALSSGKKLRIKLGIDPTGAKIHLGRAFSLWKMRRFQDLGHKAVLIIGDFTAQIGDASDKTAERQPLSAKEIAKNMKDYKEQIGKILDLKKVEWHYNSEWLSKMDAGQLVTEAMNFTVAQMIERDNFWQRWQSKKPIGLHEILYPLFQGYDSVAVKADVEIGGNDQLFNLLAGRTIQKKYGQKPQDIMTFEMMEGTDGRKMSTSYGNVINITDEPSDMYGKIMSIKDDLIERYFVLSTDVPLSEIKKIAKGKNPRDAKARLAYETVARYYGKKEAAAAEKDFETKFVKREVPKNIKTVRIVPGKKQLADILVETGLASSKSDARRLADQGGVRVDGAVIGDRNAEIQIVSGMIVQVGKRKFVKIK